MKSRPLISIFLFILVILPGFFVSGFISSGYYQIISRPIAIPKDILISKNLYPQAYIFVSESEITPEIQADFIAHGGNITKGPWKSINAFAGNIKQANLTEFLVINPSIQAYEESEIVVQMNTVHNHLHTYPEILNDSGFGLTGDPESSIALVDTGIDMSHLSFNNSFGDQDFNQKIIGWKDFVNQTNNPNDVEGHGTTIASIIAGGGNPLLELNSTMNYGQSLTVGGNFTHYDLFYPQHVSPGWYRIKLAGFYNSQSNLILETNGTLTEYSSSQFVDYQLELYRNGVFVNSSLPFSPQLHLIYNTSNNFDGLYEIFFNYRINFGNLPRFSLLINLTYIPTPIFESIANNTGIAPNAKLMAIRVLNKDAIGNISTLMDALDWIWENNLLYHISTALLSVGAFQLEEGLVDILSLMIDQIINNGTMVIIAAGNTGVGLNSLNNLGFNSHAIVVGAMNNRDQLTYYSSQGQSIGSLVNKPDILAPGGSLLLNTTLITGAETNDFEFDLNNHENIYNDSTQIGGTSVSAAIVAGIFNLIYQKLGGWNTLGLSRETMLHIKSLLLMTASETNLLREDNPSTTFNEANVSPVLNRGSPDPNEGYGRINPLPLFEMLNSSFIINNSVQTLLIASNVNSTAKHIYAINITLVKNEVYQFEMNNSGTLDADLYLYSNNSDTYGQPVLLRSSTLSGAQSEHFYYTNSNSTRIFYVIAKAISGSGQISVKISKMNNALPPIISNVRIVGNSSNNDILDTYNFQVNYSHAENFPPVFVYLHLNNHAENISMVLFEFEQGIENYQDGAWYSIPIRFYEPGIYQYYFTAQTGKYFIRYPDTGDFYISISAIANVVEDFYTTQFLSPSDVSRWNYESYPINFNLQNYNTMAYRGWEWVQISNSQENRLTSEENWGALYCGITLAHDSTQIPLLNLQTNKPQYTYLLMNGTYDLISPVVFLNSSVYADPVVRLGLRINLNQNDIVEIQVNGNRTEYETLEVFTNYNQDWLLLEYNLSSYLDTFLQLRIRVILDSNPDPSSKGVMLGYIKINELNDTNTFTPYLKPIWFNPSVDQPVVWSNLNNTYGFYNFQISYVDDDGDLPEFVYLEIGGKNYSMINSLGKWDARSDGLNNNGIIFTCNLSTFGLTNTSFHFHASDGKHHVIYDPHQNISINVPSPVMLPITPQLDDALLVVQGTPKPTYSSLWIENDIGWHQVTELGEVIDSTEWYCGVGNYLGYGRNWNTRLVTNPIFLNGTNEIFLIFDYQFLSDGSTSGDKFLIQISPNGLSWVTLLTITEFTEENTIDLATIDISSYMKQTMYFGFQFISDAIGTELSSNSGFYLDNLRIDINRTRDYERPIIIYHNFQSGQKVTGLIELQIQILDNMGIDWNRVKFFFDAQSIPIAIIDNVIYFNVNTKEYADGYILEFVTIAYDLQGNRIAKKLLLEVDHPGTSIGQTLGIIFGSFVGVGFTMLAIRKLRIKKMISKGLYVATPSIRDRWESHQFKRERLLQEVYATVQQYDKEWEKQQPLTLMCKSCKTWFKSPEFEIYCPICNKDALFIAKKCPICEKWRYFEEEGLHKCRRCKVELLKDFNAARREVQIRTGELSVNSTPSDSIQHNLLNIERNGGKET